ncbi:calcium-binding protein [Oceaniglobus roseus]|uniref:calcium-binding protein n=1 Tax=Oceaniglobus roseus TaxID=1737570 RepID=UPI000C7EC3DA|nr:calcium-binding protein [Kandeliimicrobium roseum]
MTALNGSGVSGTVIAALQMEDDGTGYLNVALAGEGFAANQTHIQHIHGRFDENGNPIDSVTPTLADDADGDGYVEVLEGLGRYGDIILPLANEDGISPSADFNGDLSFIQSYQIEDAANFFSPVSGAQYDFEDLMDLALREYVIHGVTVPAGVGAGTDGEVDGTGGYTPILPAAAGEFTETDVATAQGILAGQIDSASGTYLFGSGDDRFNADLGNDTLNGGAGDDMLFGGSDDDVVIGGRGMDTLAGGLGDDRLFGRSGNDVLLGEGGDDEGNAGGGNDIVSGGFGADIFGGGDGQDYMDGGAQNDTLNGGVGNDTMLGGGQRDVMNGGADNDLMNGQWGADTLRGGEGSDTMAGMSGRDLLTGDEGQDYASGGTGNDTITGGAGDENLANGADTGASGALTAADYDNSYAGGAGDDLIVGGIGDDIITGDDDSRVSTATTEAFDVTADGSDVLYGGAGNDEIHTGSWADSDDGFTNAQTGMADDIAYGGDGDDIIRGAGGNDRLFGDAGNDDVGGGGGDDLIVGGAGDDVLNGNDGNDILGGGAGNDELTGGVGMDEFHFNVVDGATTAPGSQGVLVSNSDVIYDFAQGEDVISFLDDGAISFANSSDSGVRGASDLSALDFDTIASLSELDAANDQQVIYTTGGALELALGTGAAVEAYIAGQVDGSTVIAYDDDWSNTDNRELVVAISDFDGLMTAADFDVY